MTKSAYSAEHAGQMGAGDQPGPDTAEDTPSRALNERARPIPRISIQAFCESDTMADVIQAASEDRRLTKAHVTIQMGGAAAAVAHFQESPTPNLIILESSLARHELLSDLDELAQHCDQGTKVVIVGSVNDVVLYRELLKRGVSEYLVAPVSIVELMESLSNLYNNPSTDPVGQVFAFIGAKGELKGYDDKNKPLAGPMVGYIVVL